MTTIEKTDVSAEEVADRVFTAALGAIDLLSIHVGDRLGWYRALTGEPRTAAGLAESTGTSERYTREWLEQQVTTGLVTLVDVDAEPAERRFTLPPGVAEVLTDESSLNYLAPLARMLAASAAQLPALLEAYRTGRGVSWADFGDDARESQAAMNRPWFEHELAPALASVEEVHSALSMDGARIADVACGGGWSSIALARAYPNAVIEGFDIDAPSIDLARANADAAGVANRVTFHAVDAVKLAEPDTFDAAFVFEAVHDMSRPVEVLRAIREATRDDGLVIVMDEAVGDRLMPGGDDVEKLMYGFSLLVCLPDGLSSAPSVGTGTVMRPDQLAQYAREAGYSSLTTLPIEDFAFFRFYRLVA